MQNIQKGSPENYSRSLFHSRQALARRASDQSIDLMIISSEKATAVAASESSLPHILGILRCSIYLLKHS